MEYLGYLSEIAVKIWDSIYFFFLPPSCHPVASLSLSLLHQDHTYYLGRTASFISPAPAGAANHNVPTNRDCSETWEHDRWRSILQSGSSDLFNPLEFKLITQ